MTTALRAPDMSHPLGQLPPEFATVMRPELPSLIHEVTVEIRRTIPEYSDVLQGPYARAVRHIVDQNLTTFVDKVETPGASTSQRDKVCRRFGRFEAYEGRNLDTMQATFRVAARLALRRAKKIGRRYHLSSAMMLSFADALFAYVDELVELAREGYLEARAELEQGQESHRRRLLQHILSGPGLPHGTLTEAAERAGWTLPDQVTLVALGRDALPDRGALSGDVLADLDDPRPHALIPGAMDADRRAVLANAPTDVRAVVGLTVPLEQATESLRWARRGLGLVENGIIADSPVTYCEDHLVTLWLFADTALLDALARQRLAPLAELTASQRERLVDTLRAWLDTRGNAVQMAERLHLHPQTVRYRLRNLDRAFGAQLTQPDTRFALELALRALQLRGAPAVPQTGRRRAAAGRAPGV